MNAPRPHGLDLAGDVQRLFGPYTDKMPSGAEVERVAQEVAEFQSRVISSFLMMLRLTLEQSPWHLTKLLLTALRELVADYPEQMSILVASLQPLGIDVQARKDIEDVADAVVRIERRLGIATRTGAA